MKTFVFGLTITYIFLLFQVPDKDIIAKLEKIEYYSKGICKDTSFVYVRVLYRVKGEKPENLTMKHDYLNGITLTMPVSETDKKGNFVYGFCLDKTDVKEFSTVFISSDGSESNRIYVKIDAADADIISGTAPSTLKTNR